MLAACGGDDAPAPDTIEADTAEVDAPDTSPDAIADSSPDANIDVAPETWTAPADRLAGERTPRTARCDDIEPTRCFLPWPSNAFVVADTTTPTGLRLSVATDVLPADEGIETLVGDGFSRLSPIVVALPVGAQRGSGRVRAFVAEPGPDHGAEVPLSVLRYDGRSTVDADVLVAYPLRPLAPASEHLVIVDGVVLADGSPMSASTATSIALGRVAPTTLDEATLAAYFAPARELLADFAIDTTSIQRAWDFTTRSAGDALAPLQDLAAAAREAVATGAADIVVESVTAGEAPIAAIVRGRIEGLPDPLVGEYAVPFRVVVPTGAGDYRVVLYGHGTGGDVSDTSFDALIAGSGAAKVNVEIDGWTGDTVAEAVSGLLVPLVGTRDIVARMRRAIAGIAAIQAAIAGSLGDQLGAATLAGVDNPVAGRLPLRGEDGALDRPLWAGGSLGGVIGMVYGHLEPTIVGGVLNVPGAGFTHWLGQSALADILSLALASRYEAMLDQQLAAAMAQTTWDQVDGGVWAGSREVAPIFLVQMSVGDPIMPNLATALVATSLDAVMLAPADSTAMVPVHGLARATEASGVSALTEFRTDATSNSGIHGFAASDRPAGLAARAQIFAFMTSLWIDMPRATIPEACLELDPPGVCDFSD